MPNLRHKQGNLCEAKPTVEKRREWSTGHIGCGDTDALDITRSSFFFLLPFQLTQNETLQHTRRPDVYRYAQNASEALLQRNPRPWGGLNVMLIGDWWQLHPTGSMAIMSNPFATSILENASAQSTMHSLWCALGSDHALQDF